MQSHDGRTASDFKQQEQYGDECSVEWLAVHHVLVIHMDNLGSQPQTGLEDSKWIGQAV